MHRSVYARQTVTLAPGLWSDAAASELSDIVNTDFFRSEVEGGRVNLWTALISGERVGTLLWRTDNEPDGKALVIVAASGGHTAVDLIATVLPVVEEIGRALDCTFFRFHTQRAGMVRKMENQGFEPLEYVMRKRLV